MALRLSPLLGLVALSLGCAAAPATAPAPAAPTSAAAGGTTIVAIQPPASPAGPGPIGRAIQGIGTGLRRVGQGVRNRLGMRFPGLESKPAVTSITDPANSSPDADPAAQAAAEIKASEDGAEQKIKALRYLGRIGCSGCYPGIEDAFLSALEDCTEEVRYEAVRAIRSNGGGPCAVCASGNCCSEKLLKKLNELGSGMTDNGCFREPSARVRRLARIAVSNCGGYNQTAAAESVLPAEGPPPAVDESASPDATPPPAPVSNAPAPASDALPPPTDNAASAIRGPVSNTKIALVDYQKVVPQSELVAARVDDVAIREADLLLEYVIHHPKQPIPGSLEDLPNAAQQQLIKDAIGRVLLAREAARRMPAEQVAMLIASAFPGASDINPREKEQLLADAWMQQVRSTNQPVDEAALQRLFDARYATQQAPAQARWEQLSVNKQDFATRAAAVETLDFARQRALGFDAPAPAGFRGERIRFVVNTWTSLDTVPVPRRDALSRLKPGAISGVIDEGEMLYVCRLLERREARPLTLDDVRPQLVAAARQESASRFDDVYVEQLRSKARIWSILDAANDPVEP